MNILEALEVALPDLPAQTAQRRFPKLDPRVISREHIEQGVRVVLAKMPGSEIYLRFTPEQWQLLQLFDGERSYKQIADLIFSEPMLRSPKKMSASSLRISKTGDLFYKTPLEKNITLRQNGQ